MAEKSYVLTYSKILGYGTPLYQEEPEMTYEQFKEYMTRYEAEKRALPVSDWAKDAWQTATELKLFDGSMPQSPLTREQAAEVIRRLKEGR